MSDGLPKRYSETVVSGLINELQQTVEFIQMGTDHRSALAQVALRGEATLGDIAVGSRRDLADAQERIDILVTAGLIEVVQGGDGPYEDRSVRYRLVGITDPVQPRS